MPANGIVFELLAPPLLEVDLAAGDQFEPLDAGAVTALEVTVARWPPMT